MKECVYCSDPAIRAREVLRTELVRVFPTNIPIVPGHMLVCPVRCVATIGELTAGEHAALADAIARTKEALRAAFGAEGFNHAWNEGEVAGQGVPHLHIHIVPRKSGDAGITEYEPRKFLYRPGSREESPESELRSVVEAVRTALPNDMREPVSPTIFALYFSGFSAHAIDYKGVRYPTLEHAYHCLRYDDAQIVEEIRATKSPEEAWRVSQTYKGKRLAKYAENDKKLELMEALMRAKLAQHADVRRALVESADRSIVKKIVSGPPGDGFWDIGEGEGDNHVGKIWMKLRAELI